MNKQLISEAKKLREMVDELPEVKEYYRLKKLIECDDHLKKMRNEIAEAKYHGDKEKHEQLLSQYNSHPLVSNYESSKEEVQEILLTIKNILD